MGYICLFYNVQSSPIVAYIHHYECVALCKDISLQRGRFPARSLASCIPKCSEKRGRHECPSSKLYAAAPVVASSSLEEDRRYGKTKVGALSASDDFESPVSEERGHNFLLLVSSCIANKRIAYHPIGRYRRSKHRKSLISLNVVFPFPVSALFM